MTIDRAVFATSDASRTAAANSAARADAIIVHASKAAAALFGFGLAYLLSKHFIAYATEPKPIGGLYIDAMPDRATPWTPVYYPIGLATLFAWWRWPRKSIRPGAWSLLRGGLIMAQVGVFCIFASFVCAHVGGYLSALPFILQDDLVRVFFSSLAAGAGMTIFFTVFFAALLFPVSITYGLILASITQSAARLFGSQAIAASGHLGFLTLARNAMMGDVGSGQDATGAQRQVIRLFSALAAGLIAVLLILAFRQQGWSILFQWAAVLVSMSIPCAIAGGVLAWQRIAWPIAVLAGEIVSLWYGHDPVWGFDGLSNQIFNAPPIIGATLIGYAVVDAFRQRRRQSAA